MPKPIKDHVERILAKHDRNRKVREAIDFGWHSRTGCPGHATWARKGTRASVVWEGSRQRFQELMFDDPDCAIIPHHDTFSYVLDDSLLLRFKKANVTLQTNNYPTPLHGLFDEHDEDLFGYNGLQRVEAVYVLDRFETKMVWAGIVAFDRGRHLWHFELPDEGVVAGAITPKPRTDTSGLATLKGKKTEDGDNVIDLRGKTDKGKNESGD